MQLAHFSDSTLDLLQFNGDTSQKCRNSPAALLIALGILSSGAFAKDLDALIRLLVPAYMAQNFAAVVPQSKPAVSLSELKNSCDAHYHGFWP
jgi:hypothetical protein